MLVPGPLLSIWQGKFGSSNWLAPAAQTLIGQNERLLIIRNIVIGKNGFDGTFRNANCAIDACTRVDGEEIKAFAEGVDQANVDAVRIFAPNTRLCNGKGHDQFTREIYGDKAAFAMRVAMFVPHTEAQASKQHRRLEQPTIKP